MDDELLKIYSLMKAAEDQFTALREVSLGLRTERAAVAQERALLEKTLTEQAHDLKTATANLKTVGAAIRQETKQITPALQEAVQEAVGATMRQTLSLTTTHVAKTLETASAPILERLAGVTQAASVAEASLKNAGQWFAWKWVALATAGTAGMLLMAYFVLIVLNSSYEADLVRRHQTLVQDITRLQETADVLEKRTYGLRIVTGGDGAFLVVPKGAQTTQCKAGPCIRLE